MCAGGGAVNVRLNPPKTPLGSRGSLAVMPGCGQASCWMPARLNDQPSTVAAVPAAVRQESTVYVSSARAGAAPRRSTATRASSNQRIPAQPSREAFRIRRFTDSDTGARSAHADRDDFRIAERERIRRLHPHPRPQPETATDRLGAERVLVRITPARTAARRTEA